MSDVLLSTMAEITGKRLKDFQAICPQAARVVLNAFNWGSQLGVWIYDADDEFLLALRSTPFQFMLMSDERREAAFLDRAAHDAARVLGMKADGQAGS